MGFVATVDLLKTQPWFRVVFQTHCHIVGEKEIGKPQTTARNVMRFPLKPYPWDILTIINCYNCRISATSPHTAWLMNTFHSEAKMVRTKGCRCHPIPPWNMRFIFSKHHGLRHDDFEGLGCFSEVLEGFSEDRRGYLVIHGRG